MSKDDARTRILEAAGPVFAEKGFQAATVREICDAAGMNVASINYYFGDKQRLYVETIKYAHRPLDEVVDLTEWPEGTPTSQKLKDYIRATVERMLADKVSWPRQLMMREILNPTSACRELVESHFRVRFDRLLHILDEVLPEETPSHVRHKIAFSIIGQCLHYRVAGEIVEILVGEEEAREQYSPEELAEHISRMTLASLGLAPPIPQAVADESDCTVTSE